MAVHRPPAAADEPRARAARARATRSRSTAARPSARPWRARASPSSASTGSTRSAGSRPCARWRRAASPAGPGAGGCCRCCARWLADTIPDQLADLDDVLAAFAPDAIATDLSLWGPIVVLRGPRPRPGRALLDVHGPADPRARTRRPSASASPRRAPAVRAALARAITALTELAATPMRRQVDAIRAEHGLPPLGTSVNRATARLPLYLVGNIRELDYDRRDLPASVHYIGNNLWFPPPTAEETAWLDAIPADRPWVHVTESTLAFGRPVPARRGRRGARRRGRRGDRDQREAAARRARTAAGERPRRAVDQPRRAAAALRGRRHRRRQGDDPRRDGGGRADGARAHVVGQARQRAPRDPRGRRACGCPRARCTPEALRDAVRQVLHDPRHARAAREMARRLAAAPGAEGGAELLETLVPAARRPAYADGGVQ